MLGDYRGVDPSSAVNRPRPAHFHTADSPVLWKQQTLKAFTGRCEIPVIDSADVFEAIWIESTLLLISTCATPCMAVPCRTHPQPTLAVSSGSRARRIHRHRPQYLPYCAERGANPLRALLAFTTGSRRRMGCGRTHAAEFVVEDCGDGHPCGCPAATRQSIRH